MAVQVQGNDGTVIGVESTYRAQRVTLRHLDPGTLGSYGIGLRSGIMAAGLAGGADIFHFRWTDATRLAVVHRVTFGADFLATAFTAGAFSFDLAFARAWTVVGSGG